MQHTKLPRSTDPHAGWEWLEPLLDATGWVYRSSVERWAPPTASQLLARTATNRNVRTGHEPDQLPDIGDGWSFTLEEPPSHIGRGKRYRPAAVVAEINLEGHVFPPTKFHPEGEVADTEERLLAVLQPDGLPPFPEPYLTFARINTARPWTDLGRHEDVWFRRRVIVIHRSDDTIKVQHGINAFQDATRAA